MRVLYEKIQEECTKEFLEVDRRMVKLYEEIAGKLHFLIRQIRHGAALEGHCRVCPPIQYKKES